MAIRKLEKPEWRPFFDAFSRLLDTNVAEIEVASLDLGDQIETEWLRLNGITYDPKDDIIEVAFDEDVDHLINKPREVYVDDSVGGLMSIEVVDADGVRQIVKLKEQLALPSPQS